MNAKREQNELPSGAWPLDRRRFLEAAGFSLSITAVAGCMRAPVEYAMPLGQMPDSFAPGKLQYYAATCSGCSAGCGLLVGVRDGRPLKMEGMPEHPLSRGGLCAVAQAMPIGLYDRLRLNEPMYRGKPSDWKTIDRTVADRLETIRQAKGGVRIITGTRTSPTLEKTIADFLAPFDDGRHLVVDLPGASAIREAHAKTHGVDVLPRYRFEHADVIVSFGADFLGTWIAPVEHTAGWRTRRLPTPDRPDMSYHVQLESQLSLTGGKADRRFRVAPREYRLIVTHLAARLGAATLPDGTPSLSGAVSFSSEDLDELVQRLKSAGSTALVISDSPDVATQELINAINHALGAYGKTIDVASPSHQRKGSDRQLATLLEELDAGKIAALFVADVDLLHDLPESARVQKGLKKVELLVRFAEHVDATARVSHIVCPESHMLESWADHHPVAGLVSLTQPTIRPLGNTRSLLECLARWSGKDADERSLIRAHWEQTIWPKSVDRKGTFESFWDHAVQTGFVPIREEPLEVKPFTAPQPTSDMAGGTQDDYTLVLYSKVGMPSSRLAHNPWLQELPDPVTKVAWDNYVCVSPRTAEQLGVVEGDEVEISAGDMRIELPAYVLPGQHDRVLGVALGYGCPGTERFATIGPQWLEGLPTVPPGKPVGRNAAPFLNWKEGALHRTREGVRIRPTGRHRDLAVSQMYHSLKVPDSVSPPGAAERDDLVQITTLDAFRNDPSSGKPESHHVEGNLWPPDHPKEGHAWGLLVDLNACTGCSACVIACQSENNIPVVGWDEMRRHRDMYWMRIDRYIQGDEDDVDMRVQPVMCQHCDHAPCETVCPVLATVHSEEGLNQQAYNRCVGTRYCANNCPFKVRRFNWFQYRHDDDRENLALNPDVVVRSRGVMEKCSMCIQRIEAARVEAKHRGVPIADGDIEVACQQSCPSQAILFGDLNDPESRLAKAARSPRQYRMLEEFGFRTSVGYQRIVRNREET